jgi:hypothetical protein
MLHKHLLLLLEQPMTTVVRQAMRDNTAAFIDHKPDHWLPYKLKIIVDANKEDLVSGVLHELLHAMFCFTLGFVDDTLNEVMICGLEEYMVAYVNERKTRRAKWETLIAKKLAECEPFAEPLSLRERMDRPSE